MKTTMQSKLARAASLLELIVGFCVLISCVICGVGIVVSTDVKALFSTTGYFQILLSDACYIIIGIEFIKMIASHTLDSVIDVMLLAVARQMIVEHTSPVENLLAVGAVAILFVVRKYLYISQLDKPERRAPGRKGEAEAAPAQEPAPSGIRAAFPGARRGKPEPAATMGEAAGEPLAK